MYIHIFLQLSAILTKFTAAPLWMRRFPYEIKKHTTEKFDGVSFFDYLEASSIATATATVIPTMGLLPAPMRPIISVR